MLVRFGGGVRRIDLFGERNRCLAPFLRGLAGSGTLYSELWNDHLTRHDAATLYLLTGRYGKRCSTNADGPANVAELTGAPSLFEVFRHQHDLPAHKVLAAGVPAHSEHPSFGPSGAALAFASADPSGERSISGDPSLADTGHVAMANRRLARLVAAVGDPAVSLDLRRRSYLAAAVEDLANVPPDAPELAPLIAEALAARMIDERPYVAPQDADNWLMDLTLRALRKLRPDLTMLAFSTPDLAHRGSWKTYAAAVRQIDIHLSRLWKFLQTDSYYRDRTMLLVASDCGRGRERFDRHQTPFDDPAHRSVFLAAAGAGVRPGVMVTERRQQVDVAVTAAAVLGCELPDAEGVVLEEIVS